MARVSLRLLATVAGGLMLLLTGCVAYPAGYAGYDGYYQPAPAVVVPVPLYGSYHGGYRGGYRGGYGGHYR